MKSGDLVVLLSDNIIDGYSIKCPLGIIVKNLVLNNGGKWNILCEFFTGNSNNRQIYMAPYEIELFFNRIR